MSYGYPIGLRSRAADPDAARDLRKSRRPRRRAAAARGGGPRVDRAARATRPRVAGARDSARGPSRGVDRPRRLARRARARREPGRRHADGRTRRRSIAPRSKPRWRSPTRSPRRSATRASTFAFSRAPTRRRSIAALWSWQPALAVRAAATFAFTNDKRTTAALAIEHLAQHAPVPRREIALPGGLAVRHDRRRPRRVHDVPRVRRRLPRGRDPGQPGGAAAALHRSEVRAMRDLREDLPGERDHARSATQPRRRGEAAARRQRGDGVRVHRLRQAARPGEDDRQHAGQARRAFDVRRPGRARPAADVRRLPRDRPDEERARASTSAMSETAARTPRNSSRRTRRARTSTRCSRGFFARRRMRRC